MQDEDEEERSILHNFSLLAEGILAIWEGEDSVRRRIEVLIERQQVKRDKIRLAEEEQKKLRERLGAIEEQAQDEQTSLQRLRQERLHALAQGMKPCSTQAYKSAPSLGGSELRDHHRFHCSDKMPSNRAVEDAPKGVQHGPTFYASNLRVACELLDLVHERLTSYMWAYMCGRVKSMHSAEERGEFLRIFKGVQGKSAFGTKPLSEATYAELLDFALSKKTQQKEVEVEAVLEAAEKRLVQEAAMAGFRSIGDTREQMRAYLQLRRQFKSAQRQLPVLGFRNTPCSSHGDTIPHVLRLARRGQLGALQPASTLVQFACFFLTTPSMHIPAPQMDSKPL